MLPTLRRLLARPELSLRLLTPEGDLPPGSLDQGLEWVHSSDLADPTPFLSPSQVLLTTGTQFTSDAPGEAFSRGYVARLRERGITGLGFGTEVVREGTPDALVAACLADGLPLFEVPYRTPFIAVARAAGDMVAEERFARHTWTLGAQRAIALAALRPDGLGATLSELSRQLGHWVALFDATGGLDRVFPRDAFARSGVGGPSDMLQREAALLLRRGQRASSTVVDGGESVTLQTLGRGGQLRGVLALGGQVELDPAGQEVVTSVVALAGLALEQNSALGRARGKLRSGLLQALLGGSVELVQSIIGDLWGPLPAAPVRIAAIGTGRDGLEDLIELLELRVEARPGQLFFARQRAMIVLLVDRTTGPLLTELSTAFGLHIGVSDPAEYGALPRALAQAERALERSRDGAPAVLEFEIVSRQGVLAYLARTDAGDVGRATLEPLVRHDAERGTELLASVRVWLEHNGQYGPAADVLGVHRHTLRARIGQAEQVLGRDLAAFPARADLWAAFVAAG
ncbi:PucR family transcriptional regulator [Cryobacterium tagatosivorans]|uniref:PucR family transcriptional regulator n=1 Tax=Cryobacterium tagatosivorans TaxID=1259199 RepID=A0A4V3I617_9MICO|nr:PucR family transcriptional regulator [Cryobacterium tagatosivorans]TFB46523.1 PucR family transcriptional regulator [Cryobacterium tagatosivorans]